MRRTLVAVLAAWGCGLLPACGPSQGDKRPVVEVIRDRWGVAHVFATTESDGFFGVGYATAEDRLLQMELFRRRATGRLAELFGEAWIESDRKFRIAGVPQYCTDAAASLPPEFQSFLRSYAAGVNAFMADSPDTVRSRFARLPITPAPWTEGDCVCSWMAVAEIFDRLFDDAAVSSYNDFQQLASELGEAAALEQRGMITDDAAAVVPESEMAKDAGVYLRLRATPPTPGFWRRSYPDDLLRFSHAWAVDGTRSVTGKPLLESDPQTSVNNPPLWYEFHLSAGRFDVRGIGVAGSPGLLIGFNRRLAWGASALGASATVTFVEKLSGDRQGYLYAGQALPFERRTETIQVRAGRPVVVEVQRTRHGFVFDALSQVAREGEAAVSHNVQIEEKRTSLAGMLGMMAASNWGQFTKAMEDYDSPGLHVVYADSDGNLGYQTLVHIPRTRRTPRMALEGWTGQDEVSGRIPLEEMPRMLNPDAHFISHANNLPVGSWYPHDLGIGTGGTGHSSRSLRLRQLLEGPRLFSVPSFESDVHRNDVHAAVAALYPVARRVAQEENVSDQRVLGLLAQLRDWDLRYRAGEPTYSAAMALGGAMLTPYRQSRLNDKLGGGEGGIVHLARLLEDQFGENGVPRDREVRDYLLAWLQTAAANLPPGRTGGQASLLHPMPYQENGPLRLPSLDARLDLVSPPLSCGQVGTIWSQTGNSYTQIVDLADLDNSRSLLPPGVSEDPASPFHGDQMSLWAAGTTHPAPLSRAAVEAIASSRRRLEIGLRPGH